MNLKLIAHTENPERVIALAGKLCYSEATIEEIELKMKEAIRNPKLPAKKYNVILRCAGALGIDLTPELRKVEEEDNLNKLYKNDGKNIDYVV